ncbi:hypothetical protein BC827DRAFT_1385966 [Russula dissimulans]|nr:hypothetical protein BC827DRAFT_1385966 [Russula dissimulans]
MSRTVAVIKLWHAAAGLYLWEFFTTLDYEWNIIQGRRPFRWPAFLIYSVTRLATLMSIVFALFNLNAKGHYNCEAVAVFTLGFGYIAFSGGSFLILLRMIAIWNKRKSIIAIAAIMWGTYVAFLIQGIVRAYIYAQIRSAYLETMNICMVTNVQSLKLNIIVTLVSDILLLLIMLIGLLRLRYHEHGAFSMGRLLWKQGLIWLFIATASEVPQAIHSTTYVFICYLWLFWVPSLVALSIAATRIHRSLADFAYENTGVYGKGSFIPAPPHDGRRPHTLSEPNGSKTLATGSGHTAPKANPSGSLFTPPNDLEVTIHMAYEGYQTPTSIHSGSVVSGEEQLGEKPAGLGLDNDVEKMA